MDYRQTAMHKMTSDMRITQKENYWLMIYEAVTCRIVSVMIQPMADKYGVIIIIIINGELQMNSDLEAIGL